MMQVFPAAATITEVLFHSVSSPRLEPSEIDASDAGMVCSEIRESIGRRAVFSPKFQRARAIASLKSLELLAEGKTLTLIVRSNIVSIKLIREKEQREVH